MHAWKLHVFYSLAIAATLFGAMRITHAFAEIMDIQNLAPPALVECKNDAECDRDSSHLEAFTAKFYEWYVADRKNHFALLAKAATSKSEQDKLAIEYAQKETRILRAWLTPRFYRWYEKSMRSYDGDNPSPFCEDPDSNPILCQYKFADKWLAPVSAKVIELRPHTARILLYLPAWTVGTDGHHAAYKLLVSLTVVEGSWRIDEVRSYVDNGK